jgi:hypothetical protein
VSLEGYIVGRMFLTILQKMEGDLTRENFMRAVRGQKLDIGGLQLDFSNDNQGSDLVQLTYLEGDEYKPLDAEEFSRLMQQ